MAYLRLAFRLAEADANWSMATHDGRLREALLLALGPLPIEQPSVQAPISALSCAPATSAPGSMSPTARAGSTTGSAGSPNPAAPDPLSTATFYYSPIAISQGRSAVDRGIARSAQARSVSLIRPVFATRLEVHQVAVLTRLQIVE